MILNVCLVLLLVAVSMHCSYGGEMVSAWGSNCTTSSDCTFDHSYCRKYDQCEIGSCRCPPDYVYDRGGFPNHDMMCKKLLKIGERCDDHKDGVPACYAGYSSCKNSICTCDHGYRPSEDKKGCVTYKLGEACQENKESSDYKKCHISLTCSPTSAICICDTGWKAVGDICKGYTEGEECDESPNASPRKLCQYSLKCVNKTCRCDEGKKEVTLKYLNSNGVKVTTVVCVNDKATLGVSVNSECTRMKSDYLNIDETGKICDDYLTCYSCEGKSSTLTNSARCLSGPTLVSQSAGHLSVNVMVMFGLLVLALLFTLC